MVPVRKKNLMISFVAMLAMPKLATRRCQT